MEKENNLVAYESVLVMDPSLAPEGQRTFFQEIKKIIEQFQGFIHHIDTWGLRKMANKNQKKASQGRYFHFLFKANSEVIAELLRRIRIHDSVIYHHFEKLSSKKTMDEHLQIFRQAVEESVKKEKDRFAQLQQRRKHFSAKKAGA